VKRWQFILLALVGWFFLGSVVPKLLPGTAERTDVQRGGIYILYILVVITFYFSIVRTTGDK